MPNKDLISKISQDDIVDIKQQSLYARLKRLFATDVIVRHIGGKKLKIKDSDEIMYATDRNSLRDRFNRVRSTAYNAYTRDFALSYQAARLDLFRDYDCVGPDTIIPLPDGTYPTIAELTEKYKDKPQERFFVFSYDHKTNSIKLGKAFHPRKKKGTRIGFKVTFDNGQFVIGSIKHPFLMRNGEYKTIFDLKVGESVMPFYRNDDRIYKSVNEVDLYFMLSEIGGRIIKSIESIGPIDVYDVTVEEYHNFATDSVFVSNTMDLDPILSSALDIFSDESLTENEMGEMLTIDSKNNNIKEILHNLFYDILNVEFNLWSWIRNMPVKYDSYIPLLSGENIRIDELSKRVKSGEKLWVYSVQDGTSQTVPGKVVWCDKTNTSRKIIKVVFDDDSFIETSPEHPFLLRDGIEKRADELKENDSLMPFYRKLSPEKGGVNKYEMIYNPALNEYGYTHRIVAESCGVETDEINRILHHENFNKYDNSPTNLVPMEFFKHRKLHAEHCIKTLHTPEVIEKRREKLSKKMKELRKNGVLTNHKVKRIEVIDEISDVYCMTVLGPNGEHDRHNFAICGKDSCGNIVKNSGVFVKNCKYGDFYLKLHISPEYGVYLVEPLSSYNVERIENSDPLNKNYVKFQVRPVDTSQAEMLESFQVAHFRLLSDSNFLPYGKCLVGDSHIDTEFGSKYIRDLNIGDKIWTFNIKSGSLELSSVKNKVNSGKKEIVKISTQHNFVAASTNHPILTYSSINNNFIYKQAEEIKLGDLLVINSNNNKNISTDTTCKSDFKKYNFIQNENIFLEPVRKIEYIGEKETWDIQVESENSNFFANGILVHNSLLEPARRVWKQLSLLEDAMLIHRIMRAPEKRIFKIDIGNIPPNEVDNFMEKTISKLKKVPYVDERTGDYNLRFNLQNMVEDFYLPVRGDSGASIENLPGLEFTGIDDLEYVKNKMMAALKIPKSFLGYEEGLCISPETKIPLLNGEEKTVYKLIEDYNNGIKNYVFSIDEDTKNIVPGEIEWAGFTKMNTEVVRVTLDNGESIDCTPDHPFMTRDGKWINAIDLIPNQSLMPLYLDKNHKVVSVVKLSRKIDTCDITIKKHHNFAVSAGVIVHNSGKASLAAEDVRFARTISRLQKMVISELDKIAQVHLYAQGYRDASIVDFTLGLTNPSTIFEKEKMEILSSKLDNAKSMWDMSDSTGPFFSRKFMYKSIFKLSDDDILKNEQEIVEDCKQLWRLKQIAEEGNDPAKPFQKINPNADGGGGGDDGGMGGGGGGGGLGDLGGEGEGGGDGEIGGGELGGGGEAEAGGEAGAVKETTKHGVHSDEYNKNRDQTGEKKATDYPRGEDVLGDQENRREFKCERGLSTRFIKESPREKKLDFSLINKLDNFLSSNVNNEKKDLIKESVGGSMLDEKNIIEE